MIAGGRIPMVKIGTDVTRRYLQEHKENSKSKPLTISTIKREVKENYKSSLRV